MDLSVLPAAPSLVPSQANVTPDPALGDGFRELVGQLGREITAPLAGWYIVDIAA